MSQPPDRVADERLADWIDGRMNERERGRFEGELRVNAKLRADLAEYERTVGAIRAALQSPTAPVSVADRVFARLAAAQTSPSVASRSRRGFGPFGWSLSTAAALMLLAMLVNSWSQPPVQDQQVAKVAATDSSGADESGSDSSNTGALSAGLPNAEKKLAEGPTGDDAVMPVPDSRAGGSAAGGATREPAPPTAAAPGAVDEAKFKAAKPPSIVALTKEPAATEGRKDVETPDPLAIAAPKEVNPAVVADKAKSAAPSLGPTAGGPGAVAPEHLAGQQRGGGSKSGDLGRGGAGGSPAGSSAPLKLPQATPAPDPIVALLDIDGVVAAPSEFDKVRERGEPVTAAVEAESADHKAALTPLDDEQLQAVLLAFFDRELTAKVQGNAAWQTTRGPLRVSPCVLPPPPVRDDALVRTAGNATAAPVREIVWLVDGERAAVQLLLARVGELVRAREWQLRAGETALSPAPTASATDGGLGRAAREPGLPASPPSVAAANPRERLVLRFRLRAR